jgi:hypothetical protein
MAAERFPSPGRMGMRNGSPWRVERRWRVFIAAEFGMAPGVRVLVGAPRGRVGVGVGTGGVGDPGVGVIPGGSGVRVGAKVAVGAAEVAVRVGEPGAAVAVLDGV